MIEHLNDAAAIHGVVPASDLDGLYEYAQKLDELARENLDLVLREARAYARDPGHASSAQKSLAYMVSLHQALIDHDPDRAENDGLDTCRDGDERFSPFCPRFASEAPEELSSALAAAVELHLLCGPFYTWSAQKKPWLKIPVRCLRDTRRHWAKVFRHYVKPEHSPSVAGQRGRSEAPAAIVERSSSAENSSKAAPGVVLNVTQVNVSHMVNVGSATFEAHATYEAPASPQPEHSPSEEAGPQESSPVQEAPGEAAGQEGEQNAEEEACPAKSAPSGAGQQGRGGEGGGIETLLSMDSQSDLGPGLTVAELARAFGADPRTIVRHLEKLELEPDTKAGKARVYRARRVLPPLMASLRRRELTEDLTPALADWLKGLRAKLEARDDADRERQVAERAQWLGQRHFDDGGAEED